MRFVVKHIIGLFVTIVFPNPFLIADSLEFSCRVTNLHVSFEYILLKGVNDTDQCVQQLVELTKPFDVYVNLIPYNNVDENGFVSTDYKTAMALYSKLSSKNVRCTLRQKHGDDIDAACGQLRSKYQKEKEKQHE